MWPLDKDLKEGKEQLREQRKVSLKALSGEE